MMDIYPLFLASRKQTSIGCRLASLHLKLFSMLRCNIVDPNNYRKMIQLQTMRLSSMNALVVSSRRNVLLTNEEAECGAVTTDDLGTLISNLTFILQRLKMMTGKYQVFAKIHFSILNNQLISQLIGQRLSINNNLMSTTKINIK